jgi:pimeloyl-ACP methyl ester carboxylesterase
VVVLIAGLGGNGSYWLAQTAALQNRFQVVSYDQSGTGNNPATLPDGYSMADMAAELLSALQQAGINRFCVVGHALGALVGLQLAQDYPAASAHWSGQRLAATERSYPPLFSRPRALIAGRRRTGVG